MSEIIIIQPRIRWTWLRIVIYIILSLAASAVFYAIAILLLVIFSDLNFGRIMGMPKDQSPQAIGMFNFMIMSLFGLIGLFFVTWIFRKFIDRKSLISLGFSFSKYKVDLFKGMDWGMAAITIGFLSLFISGLLSIENISLNFKQLTTSFALFTIVALNEEIMFRGYILSNLTDSINRYAALLITSLIFMLMHLSNSHLSAIAMVNLFLAGILLGVYYIFRRNLWFSVGLHLTWNFFQGPVYGFEVSGVKTDSIIRSTIDGNKWLTGGEFGFEGSLIATFLILIMIFFIHQKYRFENSHNQEDFEKQKE